MFSAVVNQEDKVKEKLKMIKIINELSVMNVALHWLLLYTNHKMVYTN